MDTQTDAASSPKPLAVDKRQAATMIGISTRSIENYVTAKRLEARKIGRRTVVLVSSIERFLRRDQPSVSPSRRDKATPPSSEATS